MRKRNWVALLVTLGALACAPAFPATVLVLRFHNNSSYSDLNWVGESVAETLMSEYAQANEIVFDRGSRAEALRRLSLRPDAVFTKASLIRIGQTLDADFLCYGSYDIQLPGGESDLRKSSVQVTAQFLDLRKMHEGPELSEAGKLSELSRLEEHLAFTALHYLDPASNLPMERFLAPAKLVRVDAEESYIRGLLSSSGEQQQKWFTQALALEPHFAGPAFELGKLALQKKEYRQAGSWFRRIDAADPRYTEARFNMGLAAFGTGDYGSAATCFREVAKTYPVNEVYNNLGLAESLGKLPNAIDDLQRAVDGDPNDPAYLFNLGAALLKSNRFAEASTSLRAAVDHNPDDAEAKALLSRATNHDTSASPEIAPRLKRSFDETAFRQLKSMVQSKGSE